MGSILYTRKLASEGKQRVLVESQLLDKRHIYSESVIDATKTTNALCDSNLINEAHPSLPVSASTILIPKTQGSKR
jgi:hypothetical protein